MAHRHMFSGLPRPQEHFASTRHVHIFEDGKRPVKFNFESWVVIDDRLTTKARRALEVLREEGAFDE